MGLIPLLLVAQGKVGSCLQQLEPLKAQPHVPACSSWPRSPQGGEQEYSWDRGPGAQLQHLPPSRGPGSP